MLVFYHLVYSFTPPSFLDDSWHAPRVTLSQENNAAYMEGIPLAEYAEMAGLSHQAHLEDTKKYLKLLDVSF
jgi:hypothetical protein